MNEKYHFTKKEQEEQEIDLAVVLRFVLRKWRLLIVCGLIGILVGLPIGILMAQKDLLDVEELSPSILTQLDNYALQKELNQKLNEEDEKSYYLTLDPKENYYSLSLSFMVRGDKYEEIELASKELNISDESDILIELARVTQYSGPVNNLRELISFSSEISSRDTNSSVGYLGGTTSSSNIGDVIGSIDTSGLEEEDAKKVQDALNGLQNSGVSSTNITSLLDRNKGKTYTILYYSISFLTNDQVNQMSDWLQAEIQMRADENCAGFTGYEYRLFKEDKSPITSVRVESIQQSIRDSIAGRETVTDITVASLLEKYSTDIAYSADREASPAIIEKEDKEAYEKYWSYLTDSEFENKISKGAVAKWMIIVGVLFGFLGACWQLVAFLFSDSIVTEAILKEDYKLPVIGFVPTGRVQLKGLDKAFAGNPCGMEPSTYSYIADVMTRNTSTKLVLLKTENERSVEELLTSLKEKKAVCGDICSQTDILEAAKEAGHVYVIAELGKTKVKSLEGTLQLVDFNGLCLDGVLML